ncbi:MAG: helix-turn-helix domain-containing protein [Acidobacteriota bacterium]|nr:helix-turn-helix domain-containing protein [Acidobacteriota bacterium]MDQ2949944.1 helix-turn-helix domain-containing protein [Acidobacteriota bacterium]
MQNTGIPLTRTTHAENHYFRTQEVASFLSLSPTTVRLWAELGEIRAWKVGRQWRFAEDDISQLIRGPKDANLNSSPLRPFSRL